tara:strand:- start:22414 stop:23322 length:909 start_codon:yes stop_codon:yes gene_type:complete
MKKILIIGSGSISKKHHSAIKKLGLKIKVRKISSRVFDNFKKKDFDKLKLLGLSMIVVCSPSSRHHIQFMKIEKNFKNITVLIEKPVFEKFYELPKMLKNRYYVGYNLRFHPVIIFLKNFLKNKKIFSINLISHSYLPNWRKIDYRKSVSAKKKLGGGALLELSHEIDYLRWIFGEIKIFYSFNKKVSKLGINTDDILTLVGRIEKKTFFSLNINFFSKIQCREIKVDGNNFSLKANLLKNKIVIVKNKGLTIKKFSKTSINDTYKSQLQEIFSKKISKICTLKQALQIMKLVEKVRQNRKQ